MFPTKLIAIDCVLPLLSYTLKQISKLQTRFSRNVVFSFGPLLF